MKSGRLRAILFFILLITSLALFSLPGKNIPHLSWLNIPHLDKLIHAIIFCSLSTSFYIWLTVYFPAAGIKLVIFIILILIGYGIGIEFLQDKYIAGRSFEQMDILADTSGCFIFLAVYLVSKGAEKKLAPVETGASTKTNCL